MNILFVTYTGELYGANLALYELICGLKKEYQINPYVLMKEKGQLGEILEKDKIPVIVANFHNWRIQEYSFVSRLRGVIKCSVNTAICYNISKEIKKLNIDLIHSNSTLYDMGYLLSRRLNIPHIWHLREFGFEDYGLKYALPKFYVKKTFHKSTCQIAISRSIYKYYVTNDDICLRQNTKLVYDGIKIPNPYSKNYFWDNNINFCVVGVISPKKRQEFIIKAFSKALKSNDKIRLHILGDGKSDYVNKLKQLVSSLNIENEVIFWGYSDNIPEILKKMDVGIMASDKEAFGRVTVEYMANYIPVIGINAGATPELIDDGENGELFTRQDINGLSQLIKMFACNPEKIKRYGYNGRRKCEKMFTCKNNYDQIYEIYCDILRS